MKVPPRLAPLVEEGLIDDVIRQLMSGKEATVYVVRCGDEIRCAKMYKEANQRSFRQAVQYTEGRKVKSSRRARAMEKGSKFGRAQMEEAWQHAEVDALYRLAAAGVRVPQVFNFLNGVLLMELVTDADGNAAPRLNDVELSEERALAYHAFLIHQVVRMLCAGIIHGDLSEYNVLVGGEGPVIIDLPQAVDAAGNNQAEALLERDIRNLAVWFGQFAPSLLTSDYAGEIWSIYKTGKLTPEVALTGQFRRPDKKADLRGVIREIKDVIKEEEARQRYKQSIDR
jgi:RIO kinase 1